MCTGVPDRCSFSRTAHYLFWLNRGNSTPASVVGAGPLWSPVLPLSKARLEGSKIWPLQRNLLRHHNAHPGVSGKCPHRKPGGSGSRSVSSFMEASLPGISMPSRHSHFQAHLMTHCASSASSLSLWCWVLPPTHCVVALCGIYRGGRKIGCGCTCGWHHGYPHRPLA